MTSDSGNPPPVLLTEADFANLSLLAPPAALQSLLRSAKVVPSDAVPRCKAR